MSLLRPPSNPYLCLIWEPTGWNLSDFQMFRKKITGEPDQHLLPEATKGAAFKGWLCAFRVLILCPTHTGLVFPSSEIMPGWLGCAGILNMPSQLLWNSYWLLMVTPFFSSSFKQKHMLWSFGGAGYLYSVSLPFFILARSCDEEAFSVSISLQKGRCQCG